MTPIDNSLRELASIRSDADPVVSLYLDTQWSDEQQRDRVRLFVEDRIRWARAQVAPAHAEALERSLQRVSRFVEELWRQERDEAANGAAIFACEGLGLFRTFLFSRPFRQHFHLGTAPHLQPLAALADDFSNVIVALVERGGGRVFESVLGGLVGEAKIEHQSPQRHKMGGWSQLSWQKSVDKQIEANMKEAAAHVIFLFDRDPGSKVVLMGTPRELGTFERLLPERVQEAILARLPNPSQANAPAGVIRHEVMERAMEQLLENERRSEREAVERAVSEASAGGLAVLGAEDVALAATEGRIHELLIEDGYTQAGWRCTNCDAIGVSPALECNYCGEAVTTVDLGSELTRRVLAGDGEVDVLDPGAHLHNFGGIAALLRHRSTQRAALGEAEPQPIF